MSEYAVIGATGDVGRGVVQALLAQGHSVIGLARDAAKLAEFSAELGAPAAFRVVAGSLSDDAGAEAAVAALRKLAPVLSGAVVSINGPRKLPGLMALTSDEFTALVALDLVPHFTAARALAPALAHGGVLLGIGGGSADFILAGGAHMSVAQAALRMLYRGLAHELGESDVHVRLLTIASVVNGRSTATYAKPEWVTDREVGEKVAALLMSPSDHPHPVWRISRRDESGMPGFVADAPTRIQGLTT